MATATAATAASRAGVQVPARATSGTIQAPVPTTEERMGGSATVDEQHASAQPWAVQLAAKRRVHAAAALLQNSMAAIVSAVLHGVSKQPVQRLVSGTG